MAESAVRIMQLRIDSRMEGADIRRVRTNRFFKIERTAIKLLPRGREVTSFFSACGGSARAFMTCQEYRKMSTASGISNQGGE